ncbi:MAG: hypothetical protein EOO16_15380 [Chitinophagaceae bacterium]|nr:MAG: hypothetical protein EOO16_15380 [Chitinophagaceae bacterium]
MFGSMLGGGGDMQGHVREISVRLKADAGLSDEQVVQVLETMKEYLIEQFPMMQGMVENMLGNKK